VWTDRYRRFAMIREQWSSTIRGKQWMG